MRRSTHPVVQSASPPRIVRHTGRSNHRPRRLKGSPTLPHPSLLHSFRGPHRRHKFPHPARALNALLSLNPAANIHHVGMHNLNRLAHIARIQTTGKKYINERRSSPHLLPVHSRPIQTFACAAMPRARSIQQQPTAKRKFRSELRTEPRIHLQRPNHLKLIRNRLALIQRLIAMHLHEIQRYGSRNFQHFLYIHIYKYTNNLDLSRHCFRDVLGLLGGYKARTLCIEVQPHHLCAQRNRLQRVLHASNPANLDLHRAHRRCSIPCNSRNVASGSPERISVSPIRNALYPASCNRSMSSRVRNPLSATSVASFGASSASRSEVSTSTFSVFRLRLFTPINVAPSAAARRSSASVCTS